MKKQHHYHVDIRWSDEDKIYVARVPELVGVVTHGDTVVQAAKMAEEAICLHLNSLAQHNEKVPKPLALQKFSGHFPVRVDKDLHQSAVIRQREIGAKSLNEYIRTLIEIDASDRILEIKGGKFKPSRLNEPSIQKSYQRKLIDKKKLKK